MKHALLPNSHHEASVVSLRHKYLLVINSKTAGTTLKTVAAHLEGEPLARIERRDDQAQRIENWLRTPTLAELKPAQLRDVMFGSTYFRFTTVRHPFRRAWSAWVDKIAVAHPEFVSNFSGEPWFPRRLSGESMVEGFERFVEALDASPGLLGADRHWAPQVDVLQVGTFPYDFIGKTENFDEVVDVWANRTGLDVRAALAKAGRRNARSLAMPTRDLSRTCLERLHTIYDRDLASFGYDDELSAGAIDDSWISQAEALVRGRQAAPIVHGNRAWERFRKTSARASRLSVTRLSRR